jgi:hypothetical protein
MIEERTWRLLDVRLARDQAGQRLPSVAAGLVRDGELIWSGGRGLVDGQALTPAEPAERAEPAEPAEQAGQAGQAGPGAPPASGAPGTHP